MPLPSVAELAVAAALAGVVAAAVVPRPDAVEAVARIDGEPISAERLRPLLGGLVAESGVTAAAGRAILLEALIDEVLLVRHARRLGLGDDDPLIRRRLMQIVLESTSAGIGEPTTAETAAWYAAHATRWTSRGAVRFLADGAPEGGIDRDPDRFRARTRAAPRLHDERAFWPVEQLADLYGPGFAAAVATAPVGAVVGPLTSSLGALVVLVEDRQAPGLRPLDEVAVAVEADWRETRRREAVAALLRRLRAEATIEIAP